jgi:ribose 5-phosphate isomerase A
MNVAADQLKRAAAEAAFAHVQTGMVLGLGTGSTVRPLLKLLGDALASGSLKDIVGVPTSIDTEVQARTVGIELIGLSDRPAIDLTIDGADEVTPELDLIKGAGGALLREKMVAQASRQLIIIADASKSVDRLGVVSPVPVEVIPWELKAQVRFLESWGAEVEVRQSNDGNPLESDNGLLFLDCRFPGGIDDPVRLESAIQARAGIVESGLFLGLADEAVIASESGVEVRRRSG